jgi:hypothetical protein
VRRDATGKQAKVVVDLARIVAGKDKEMAEPVWGVREPCFADLHAHLFLVIARESGRPSKHRTFRDYWVPRFRGA